MDLCHWDMAEGGDLGTGGRIGLWQEGGKQVLFVAGRRSCPLTAPSFWGQQKEAKL